jgi:rare lipoprotein A
MRQVNWLQSVTSPIARNQSLERKTIIMIIRTMLVIMLFSMIPPEAFAKGGVRGYETVYANKYQGKKTASGKRYNKRLMTAASSKLPMGTKVMVKNKDNGRSAVVVVNDRKAPDGAKIDLSKASANKLGITGTAPVRIQVVKKAP